MLLCVFALKFHSQFRQRPHVNTLHSSSLHGADLAHRRLLLCALSLFLLCPSQREGCSQLEVPANNLSCLITDFTCCQTVSVSCLLSLQFTFHASLCQKLPLSVLLFSAQPRQLLWFPFARIQVFRLLSCPCVYVRMTLLTFSLFFKN